VDDALRLLCKYYPTEHPSHHVLLDHSRRVAQKALAVASRVSGQVNVCFVEEAALLHDIGISETYAPSLGCYGSLHYLCHGVIGRQILEKEGWHAHALVCERHIGVGLTVADIQEQDLPLPLRDMRPQSLEEKIVAYADLFFSKSKVINGGERSAEEVRCSLCRFGEEKGRVFDQWHALFGG